MRAVVEVVDGLKRAFFIVVKLHCSFNERVIPQDWWCDILYKNK